MFLKKKNSKTQNDFRKNVLFSTRVSTFYCRELLFENNEIRTTEMMSFQETVQKLIEGMNKHAARIEGAKLKALGQRNRSFSS